ncbi:hypothetical protein SKAU_G00418290 [Synaphobranchus kaupii]|uniref:Ig-like domain-containing protein n=1 Tax=Synaphobranchus kaupii TaxID=118154 RepID=A0A9Q1E651_SYNKA|nr:hypothetical protein SKAU_G00418290 [Synaphobranchus kaupii]
MNSSMYLAVKYPPREPWVNSSQTALEGSSLSLHCMTQGNPPPTLTWLKDGVLVGTITAEEMSVLELEELTPQSDGLYRCPGGERARPVQQLAQCHRRVCPSLPGGVQVHGCERGGPGDQGSNGGGGVNVHCSVSNMYGSETVRLELQQEKKYMMAVIVGTIGGVAVIAFIIAAVRYVGHNKKKENGNPGQDLVSKLENPSLFYSAVKKDKQSLRKKVHSNLPFPCCDGSDYTEIKAK